ncbi:polyhydroxyalkanoic acid system family protein [Caulobacter hibisci]|uniref:Polyhydroxyalkanoic acid system family protein n=1 Tax=Caulobacter hibisci TaxID=2035993 RepID=A0ABS0SZB6_9CAUL|nr:polyhydroxyalkanoic acid system family protein [Caulobacter hibisci]MBI1683998.1 polyhydroxyalkanoic acid system family protein [Caulobacter hibisci]
MSKPVTINIPHELGVAEAKRRIESGFEQLGAQIPGGLANVTKAWRDDVLDFSAIVMGQNITGKLNVAANVVLVEIVLPGLLGMIAGKITGQVKKQGTLLLEKK